MGTMNAPHKAFHRQIRALSESALPEMFFFVLFFDKLFSKQKDEISCIQPRQSANWLENNDKLLVVCALFYSS